MPAKVCSAADCPNLQPCPVHSRRPWAGSARDRDLAPRISGSRRQARARHVIDRDDTICHVCGYPGATEADHVIPLSQGGPDDLSNLRAVHAEPCHREKTAREAAAGRGQHGLSAHAP